MLKLRLFVSWISDMLEAGQSDLLPMIRLKSQTTNVLCIYILAFQCDRIYISGNFDSDRAVCHLRDSSCCITFIWCHASTPYHLLSPHLDIISDAEFALIDCSSYCTCCVCSCSHCAVCSVEVNTKYLSCALDFGLVIISIVYDFRVHAVCTYLKSE